MAAGAHGNRQSPGKTRAVVLASILVAQAVCGVFFAADVIDDFRWGGVTEHTLYEAAVALALLIGIGFGGLEMRRTIERNRQVEQALQTASGALAAVIQARFDQWQLTAAEQEVGILCIKGFDTAEVAKLRSTAEGTVRAQLTNIYAKADVSSRAQFLCLFLDELIESPVVRVGDDDGRMPASK